MSDQQLVQRVKSGDKLAFDELILKHQRKLLHAIKNYIKNDAEALDVIQETFIKAYKNIEGFRGDSAFYSWIYRIAINTAKNHLANMDIKSSSLKPEDEPTFVDFNKDELLATFESLSDVLRESLILREIYGFSYDEIAAKLNIPIGTVRSRIARARAVLGKRG